MKAVVVILGLALMVAPAAAQEPVKSLLPPHPVKLRVDFGLKQAMRVVAPPSPRPESPVDCAMVVKHQHTLVSRGRVITPPAETKHHLKTVTAPPCPVR